MSFTFAAEIIFRGLADRRTLPVATETNGIPSAGATLASRPSAVPTQSTSSDRPAAASRACRVRIAVSAG
ncbi:hypothetical protein F4556_000643 [Kitasatospora gansuensis]|uniref:Uncharacterized protein n=1 Tax=Kitasatospora gansuensis TaxID=258050 RepID=A0A7W7S729_9ACTN|nr:hypothetical protein [Kitasatospora gansuensis]